LNNGNQTFATKSCIKCRADHLDTCLSARIECPSRPAQPVIEYIWADSKACEGEPSRRAAVPAGFIICPGPQHHSPMALDLRRFVAKLRRDHPLDFTSDKAVEQAIGEYR
jgi:hypothetical protein